MILGRVAFGIVVGFIMILSHILIAETWYDQKDGIAMTISIVESMLFAALSVYFLISIGVL